MSPRLARRLLLLTAVILTGYGLGWADRAYGHAPVLLLALVAVVSWLAGFSHAAMPLHRQVFDANRERDEIAARLAQLEDGGAYVAQAVLRHPAVRTKLPRQWQR